ncbi:MAG: hypothetical protein MUE79_08295 [Nitratireductor sp.]|nr:hypothetical protein [Nitratireductor sp.]
MYRIMTAAAASLLLTSAALAQTTPNTFTTAQQDVFMNEQGTMRTQDEAKTKFSALSAEDQASLRATCAQIDSASGSTGTTTDTTTTGSTTGTTSGSASGTATGTMQMADMQQACQWVQGF